MVRQVRFNAVVTDAMGNQMVRKIFGFGEHPLATSIDYPSLGPNMPATATPTMQSFRVIMDELLVGNNLEEIACRAQVDDDAFDRVPLGTTPDDIAKCSVARDVLPGSCNPKKMSHPVCICRISGGCGEVAEGGPVGVLDVNQDGAADDTRFIAGAVGIKCGSIDVPIDINKSYWNPSGDQNRPAMGGFDALGPAVVLVPTTALPTNLECQLYFADSVTDKQHNKVCAPASGDVTNTCSPGDVSAFKFRTQALSVTSSVNDGDTGVARMDQIVLIANAPVAAGTITAVSLTQGGAPVTGFTLSQTTADTIRLIFTTPMAPNAAHTLKVTTVLTDTFNQPLPAEIVYNFTTGS